MVWKTIAIALFISVIALGVWVFNSQTKFARQRAEWENVLLQMTERLDSLENFIWQSKGTAILMRYELQKLALRFDMSRQKGRYLVIDRHRSHFWVRDGDAILYDGSCGVGKGRSRIAGKIYDFETPAGQFTVMRKIQDPWWYRPDWFWKEKGLEVPKNFINYPEGITFDEAVAFYNSLSKDDKMRVRAVPGYLGKYTLQIADGILIHYGRVRYGPVSHGCIRVSEKDAETLFHLLDEGAPVYVY